MRISMFVFVGLALAACDSKPNKDVPRGDTARDNGDRTGLAAEGTGPAVIPLTKTTAAEPAERKSVLEAADRDMAKVLQRMAELGGKPLATLTPEEARKQPSAADAVKKELEARGKPTTPLEMANVLDKKIPTAKGQLDARIYTPKVDEDGPLPVVAYWHGGGFVIANLDTYDASARALAKHADAIVVSLDYRRAPEAKFPAAHDDAFAGYRWVVKNAASFGGDPARIAVAGESAGGNLAANVAVMARDQGIERPLHVLLVYPVTQSSMETPSYQKWADAKPLDKAMMGWFVAHYTNTPADAKDPRMSLIDANLVGLPPTTIISAEIDPLLSDSEMLRDRLEAAKVDVSHKTYEGVTHEFFGMGAIVDDAEDAQEWAGMRLERALDE
jgi:acetyl esterase